MNPVETIIKKRNNNPLSPTEIEYFVKSYINNSIPEYQMSAMLMAIFLNGMQPDEVYKLTEIYINSGDTVKFPAEWKTVDKHSTGGVGDKITLTLAPIVAACGAKIPMISGRGLGHTGGTLDKLESINGFRTDYSKQDFSKFIEKSGIAIISQSKELVPADKRIYALRDVSGTVESLPLITASIMSKKIAEGAQNLVIDLKVGSGAFIKKLDTAKELAELLITVGEKFGQKIAVVFSCMNSPLGEYIGNALEIKETVNYLKGKHLPDIDILTKELAIHMLLLSGKARDKKEAIEKIENAISSGEALNKFRELIIQQGGDAGFIENTDLLPQAKHSRQIFAKCSGWIHEIDSQAIGYALVEVSAGRRQLDSVLNYSSGARLLRKVGDRLQEGDLLGEIYFNDESNIDEICDKIVNSYSIKDSFCEPDSIIIESINKWISL
ncbi:MAG: thymidine phosphorylase [Candidatus Cloacimonetes bacterium]|nr:thymidine phosphorylase [Candidatus Cloacimonadota bacterium]